MLTLQFIPYSDIEGLSSEKRVKKILDVVKSEKVALLEGRLTREEETGLISTTMENINSNFKGIELLVLTADRKSVGMMKKIQNMVVELISGTRQGITIIGPATIIKDIKKDPDKIQLLTVERKRKKR
ncbi:DUF2073 domain-containing protein [Candidatus Woesearchaeota archaeon]|nr:DUF2073 domain-containing protein [Candidatus Woesearchaeota archaeon]